MFLSIDTNMLAKKVFSVSDFYAIAELRLEVEMANVLDFWLIFTIGRFLPILY